MKLAFLITFSFTVTGVTFSALADNRRPLHYEDAYTQNDRHYQQSYATNDDERPDRSPDDYDAEDMEDDVEGGCPMSSDERLVCKQIMCDPMGLAEDESHDQCVEHGKKYESYLASLPPWESPAACYERNEACDKIGVVTNALFNPTFCDSVGGGILGDICEENFEDE